MVSGRSSLVCRNRVLQGGEIRRVSLRDRRSLWDKRKLFVQGYDILIGCDQEFHRWSSFVSP